LINNTFVNKNKAVGGNSLTAFFMWKSPILTFLVFSTKMEYHSKIVGEN
jgi:hypothetical protein